MGVKLIRTPSAFLCGGYYGQCLANLQPPAATHTVLGKGQWRREGGGGEVLSRLSLKGPWVSCQPHPGKIPAAASLRPYEAASRPLPPLCPGQEYPFSSWPPPEAFPDYPSKQAERGHPLLSSQHALFLLHLQPSCRGHR